MTIPLFKAAGTEVILLPRSQWWLKRKCVLGHVTPAMYTHAYADNPRLTGFTSINNQFDVTTLKIYPTRNTLGVKIVNELWMLLFNKELTLYGMMMWQK